MKDKFKLSKVRKTIDKQSKTHNKEVVVHNQYFLILQLLKLLKAIITHMEICRIVNKEIKIFRAHQIKF